MILVLGLRTMGKLKVVGIKDKDLGAVPKTRVIIHGMVPYISKETERGRKSKFRTHSEVHS